MLWLCASVNAACESRRNTNEAPSLVGHVLSKAGAGEHASGGEYAHSNGFVAAVPPEVRRASKEWPLSNRNYAGTRATTDSRISSETVSQLYEAWTLDIPVGGAYGAGFSSPLVLDDTVYFVDSQSNVFVMDGRTGALVWQKRTDASAGLPNGIAIGWGKLFVGSSDRTFVALDLKTGRELWQAPLEVPRNGGIGIPPLAYGGLVYVSTVPVNSSSQYLGGVNGTLYALDQETGAIAWQFKTIQDENLWGNPTINSGGGAWYPPTIDPARDLMYWGIGNPAPYPGVPGHPAGESRPGDNLYTNSVVALGLQDGKLNWYHQERQHDLFDLDFQNSPVLANIEVEGKSQPVVLGSGKTGTIVALDADSGGKLLWRASVGKHQNENEQDIPAAGLVVYPGVFGGVETPLAYADNTVYAAVVDWGITYYPEAMGDLTGAPSGEIVALNAADGNVKWKTDLPAPAFGAATVVNDLVFTSTMQGQILAFDRADGKLVWSYQAPLGINAPISVSGDMLLTAAGFGTGVPKLIALRLPSRRGSADADGGTRMPIEVDAGNIPVVPVDPKAQKLSDTGLYADVTSHTLGDGVRAFAPQGTLWSDAAAKQRWVYLPPGTQIDSTNMDGWVFPVGTKLWKEFSIDSKRIETRLLEKISPDDWRMLAFLWDDDEQEARAVPSGMRAARDTQHDVPNQQYCKRCHEGVADIAIGFSAVQLAEGSALTTDMLAQEGRLTVKPNTSLHVPGDDVARSALLYLHANCNGCHNPRTFISNATSVDFSLPVASLSAVENTSAYVTLTRDIKQSGGLDKSAVLTRIGSRGIQGQMPPIASKVVDKQGLSAVRAWMEALPTP